MSAVLLSLRDLLFEGIYCEQKDTQEREAVVEAPADIKTPFGPAINTPVIASLKEG
ncbi:uncharacterized protein PHALS_07311 [Plasmopara halstedii]|uniref:Uncharacterized protein n=1 Tax=Plasmopara halstedii TaxID=4781 RepID=A0A0P1B449_PLAHL|nr:uncharacterized protein PHALS_07311 [Plasmopara halstedii]CEG49553.1 hypothetical protein PHALS_07311 [Plasmopara halstedii]|eukprot:XP_024585922.1 hypothetical protein PHALS_07311 [Plasmopara halstedii]